MESERSLALIRDRDLSASLQLSGVQLQIPLANVIGELQEHQVDHIQDSAKIMISSQTEADLDLDAESDIVKSDIDSVFLESIVADVVDDL